MTALPEEKFITEEEYSVLEANAAVKHEYYAGRMYAMAGASGNHNDVAMNMSLALGTRLRGSGCRPAGSDQRIKIEATGLHTYPGLSVYCRESRFEDSERRVLLDPHLILEILSPSTERYDRGNKFRNYLQIPSLLHILLVDPNHINVDHWHRVEGGQWEYNLYSLRSDVIRLGAFGIDVPVAELYQDIDIPDDVLYFPDRDINSTDEDL